MAGSWRPIAPVVLIGVTGALVARSTIPGLPPALSLAFAGWASVLGGGVFLLATRPVDRYLRGLREGGARLEIMADELGWRGERHLVAWSPEGEWRVWTEIRGASTTLFVMGPGQSMTEIAGDAAWSAGRAAAHRARFVGHGERTSREDHLTH